jgi:hypothetical protein
MPELLCPQWETESSEDDSDDCQDLDTASIVAPEVSLQDSFVESLLVPSSPIACPERLPIKDPIDVLDINCPNQCRDAEVGDSEPERSGSYAGPREYRSCLVGIPSAHSD